MPQESEEVKKPKGKEKAGPGKVEKAEVERPAAGEAAEEVVEEKAAPKPTKKAEKKKKKGKRMHTYYRVDATSLSRLRPFCERCGPGYFMADHGDRYNCGHCGFSRYKQTPE